MFRHLKYPTILFCILSNYTFAQNLVKNPSFEALVDTIYKSKPCEYSRGPAEFNMVVQNWKCNPWVTADILTYSPDCFFIKPRTGKYMAGFIAYHPSGDCGDTHDYHEQLQGELKKPLEVGKTYTFEYWLYSEATLSVQHLQKVLGEKAKDIIPVYCNNVGVQFRIDALDSKKAWRDQLASNSKQYVTKEVITKYGTWKKFQFLIKADQPYRFFYIGNFTEDKNTKTSLPAEQTRMIDSLNNMSPALHKKNKTFWKRKKRIAYYCIDDLSMIEGNFLDKTPIFEEKSTYIFQQLAFETAKAILLENSTKEIDALFVFLEQNLQQKITIQGHTDNIGSEKSNMELSRLRAQAVADYLINKGCDTKRIKVEGMGSLQPKADNKDENGRAQNRRVAVLIQ